MKPNPNWPYLAGIFDGEGCVHIADFKMHLANPDRQQQAYRLDIHITTTSKELAHWLVKEVGGKFYKRESTNPNWKDAYRWEISGRKNRERFFKGILPYLVIKREHALLALAFLDLSNTICPEKRALLSGKMRTLTRRGKSVETNTLNASLEAKRESELAGNGESALLVTAAA